jgi:hypothetical protein
MALTIYPGCLFLLMLHMAVVEAMHVVVFVLVTKLGHLHNPCNQQLHLLQGEPHPHPHLPSPWTNLI